LNIHITKQGKSLIIFGVVLFLIGLIQGGLIPFFHNPRMALSAHLAAVQSGMAIIIFGLIWSMVSLKESLLTIAYVTNLVGMYAVWLAITLAAVFGASRALPIAGKGYSSTSTIETITEVIVVSGSVLLVISVVLILIGLCRSNKNPNA